jgi:hypothetical protein
MVGVGLHRQLGYPPDSPLVSWHNLLSRAAGRLRLDDWRLMHGNYQLAWEELVLAAMEAPRHSASSRSSESGKDFGWAAARAESAIREAIEGFLRDYESQHRETPSVRGCWSVLDAIDHLIEAGPLHIIDFNLDGVLPRLQSVGLSAGAMKHPIGVAGLAPRRGQFVRANDLELLYARFEIRRCKAWMWKPHGHRSAGHGLRMGLRDYGLQPALLKVAFDRYKGAESKLDLASEVVQKQIRQKVRELDASSLLTDPADTWVTRVMALECDVIGLSLMQGESGLHWLFTQRARNYGRKGEMQAAQRFTEVSAGLPFGFSQSGFSSWTAAWNGIGR